ncbi:retrotransposon-related protein [Tanacetum coccineum]
MLLEEIETTSKGICGICKVCQANKPDLSSYPGLLQPLPILKLVWSEISMDFIEGLPSSHGKSAIFVIVDRLSKYAHFIPLSHTFRVAQLAQVFLDNVYKLHGLPKVLVSDRDMVFVSLFWKELFKALKVDVVDRTLAARESMILLLQFYLERAQQRMKDVADAKRSDREFDIGQWVYLKLQAHRQVSFRTGNDSNLPTPIIICDSCLVFASDDYIGVSAVRD